MSVKPKSLSNIFHSYPRFARTGEIGLSADVIKSPSVSPSSLMIIQAHVAAQGVRQALGRIEAVGGQHLADTAIAEFDHAVGLGMTGLDEAVGDAV